MNFASPWMALFLLPLGFAAWRLLRRARRSGIRFSAVRRLPTRAAGWRAAVASVSPCLLLAGLFLLVVAVMRPRTALAPSSNSVDAIAIALTMDISGSMEVLDLTPAKEMKRYAEQKFLSESDVKTLIGTWSRLACVKKLFGEFVEHRPDDLMGLVTFGSFAAARVPLTADHEALLHVLRGVEIPKAAFDAQGRVIGGEGESNTAIGDGLATALSLLQKSRPKSRVVILLSDGMNNTGAVEPDAAAAAAAKLGIKVYVIGIGTRATQAPCLGRNLWGQWFIASADTTFNEGQLKSIATTTGAAYYSVNDRDSLEKALTDIDRLEKTKLEVDTWDRWDEHFAPFLVFGAMLVLSSASLSMLAARRMA